MGRGENERNGVCEVSYGSIHPLPLFLSLFFLSFLNTSFFFSLSSLLISASLALLLLLLQNLRWCYMARRRAIAASTAAWRQLVFALVSPECQVTSYFTRTG
ncbi:hypothetical protein L209DRAFT_518781 [Thermothelomyces heterothallicus CBS 203.75]